MSYRNGRDMDLVSDLLEKAEGQGYLTTDDILDTISDEDMDRANDILIALAEAGVEIYEEEIDEDDEEHENSNGNSRKLVGELDAPDNIDEDLDLTAIEEDTHYDFIPLPAPRSQAHR